MPDIKKYDNLATIQVLLFIEETLSQYYKKVKGHTCDLLYLLTVYSYFNLCCPLCEGKDCAVFIGYYERKVIDAKGTYYKAFPIARYKCCEKGNKRLSHHKTFSLLPYQLVPYTKYSISFIIMALKARHEMELSIYKLQEYLDTFCREIISIGAGHLLKFKHLLNEALNKIMISPYYHTLQSEVRYESTEHGCLKIFLKFSLEFECNKVDPSVRGPCALGYDFYLASGGYEKNAHFLFGTASQFRN